MTADRTITIDHLTRVEGHGSLTAVIKNGRLEEARFDIVEAPRLFEAFLPGHSHDQVTHMASRICGICSISHRCAAIRAVEAAFGVTVSERIRLLRRLAFHGEVIGSHALHVFFLVAPDVFGVPSVFHLPPDHRETVKRAMRLKSAANAICAAVAGRHIHPVGMEAGGFSFDPPPQTLRELRPSIETALDDLQVLLPIFGDHPWPDFRRETDYLSLTSESEYPFCEGELYSSRKGALVVAEYDRIIEEYNVPGSTAKHAAHGDAPYMVGALARFNNNHEQLGETARRTAGEIGIEAPCANPFMIPAAQLVETAHCLEESLALVDRLLDPDILGQPPRTAVQPRASRGIGAVEAPRGTLFHDYTFDAGGTCTAANLVIPTAQNLANLHADMEAYVPRILEAPGETPAQRLAILVRAYDPCISCSTHAIVL